MPDKQPAQLMTYSYERRQSWR